VAQACKGSRKGLESLLPLAMYISTLQLGVINDGIALRNGPLLVRVRPRSPILPRLKAPDEAAPQERQGGIAGLLARVSVLPQGATLTLSCWRTYRVL